jgi:hypothetical protein
VVLTVAVVFGVVLGVVFGVVFGVVLGVVFGVVLGVVLGVVAVVFGGVLDVLGGVLLVFGGVLDVLGGVLDVDAPDDGVDGDVVAPLEGGTETLPLEGAEMVTDVDADELGESDAVGEPGGEPLSDGTLTEESDPLGLTTAPDAPAAPGAQEQASRMMPMPVERAAMRGAATRASATTAVPNLPAPMSDPVRTTTRFAQIG